MPYTPAHEKFILETYYISQMDSELMQEHGYTLQISVFKNSM